MSSRKFRILCASILLLTCTNANSVANGGVTDMQNFFNSIGVYGNVSRPSAFEGQTRNYYTGGDLNIKVPSHNYQLVQFDPPRWGGVGACGTIDAYGGAFSFLNSEQLTRMLKEIGNNAQGAIFSLAMESVSPALNSVIKYFQHLSQVINNRNINSCHVASGIVTAGKDMIMGKGLKTAFTDFTQNSGVADDWQSANDLLRGSGEEASALNNMKTSVSGNESQEFWLEPGNILYRALQKIIDDNPSAAFSNDERLILQSLLGTVIIKNESDGKGGMTRRAHLIHPLIDSRKAMSKLLGDKNTSSVQIPVYSCSGALCREVTNNGSTINVKPMAYIYHQRLQTIVDKVMNRSGNISPTDYQLINISYLPVWSMIENEYRTGGILGTLNNSEDVLAISYIQALLNDIFHQISSAMYIFDTTDNKGIAEVIKEYRDQINKVQESINKIAGEQQQKFLVYLTAKKELQLESQRIRELTTRKIVEMNKTAMIRR